MDGDGTDADGGVDRTLFSYDVSGPLRPKAARVCQIVFGYEQTLRRGGTSRVYHHPGYLERPGARWVGQSVLLLRAKDARQLERELRRLGVRPRMARVRIHPAEAMAFGRHP